MFTHLHVHTEYSLLDGMCRIPQLVARAKELDMDSLAITDHGVMYGAIQFYQAAKEAGIKPIIGCEFYLAGNDRFSRKNSDKNNYHLVLLAKNKAGYQNLLQLTTKAHLEGFYYRPRVDRELLRQHNKGLIALSACMQGEVPRLLLEGRHQEAREAARWYRETFEAFYLEIQRHPIPELAQVNELLLTMGDELGIPLVATADVHYVDREDAAAHDLLLCIRTNSSVNDDNRIKMAGDYFYLQSPREMAELFQDIPQALENTRRIADMCNLRLDFGRLHLPEIELPEGKNADQFLAYLCSEGLSKYYPRLSPEIEQRLGYELEVIKQTQFANYFLVVWDIISFAKKNNILFGVRGSAAASIVLHCLGITALDPIAHKLVFERFLNLERKEMPDIDLDFQDDRRDEVLAYVAQKYGQAHVAQIITFGTLGARAALRDVGRALGLPYGEVDRVARLVPFGPGITLDRALDENSEFRNIYHADPVVQKLVDSARSLEGVARHASTHAAGVVISKEPLTKVVPLQRAVRGDGEEMVMTQFAMGDVARIGLLKMDFLGLANLTILSKARQIIQQSRGLDIDLYRLPMDDARTFDLLAAGETTGVFQLEGSGMRRYIKELKPSNFGDIAAMIALYRPGPMDHIPTFIKAKHGLEPIHYPHPALTGILEDTYGVIVYQDQVLFIVRAFAGYSLGQADIFRKAMGKKIASVMKKEKRSFITGAREKGFSEELANEVFALIEPFAGYAFNKAHSVSYALIAYQTAYLKANYPVEYMAAFLVTNADQVDKVAVAVSECRRLGITVLPPDINRSQASFTIERDVSSNTLAIRFGLAAIKNVGAGAMAAIIAERIKEGEFKSMEDFCRRADLRGVNRRVMESLIKTGVFDSLGKRGALLQSVERILSLAQREQRLRETGQSTMFDLWGETVPVPLSNLDLAADDAALEEKLAWEKELTGVYLSEHPFSSFAGKVVSNDSTLCGQIDAEMVDQPVLVAGMVTSVRRLLTKDGRPFASVVLEDLDGDVEVMVWPRVYASIEELIKEGSLLLVEGKVVRRDERIQISCERVRRYHIPAGTGDEAARAQPVIDGQDAADLTSDEKKCLVINIHQTDDEQGDVARLNNLMAVLSGFPGKTQVRLSVANGERVVGLKLNSVYTNYCLELQRQLVELVGEGGWHLEDVA